MRKKGVVSVLNLSEKQANKFFLKEESYCNFDLPSYFRFQSLLSEIQKTIKGKKLSDFYRYEKPNKPKDFEDVNHKILNNKDGRYSWRPFQLVHPALYVDLVNQITEKENWKLIKKRFQSFSSNERIKCVSIPLQSKLKNSDRAEQINEWWSSVEQKSIELSLDFQYIIKTDITDCYSSIYTHSISWAIHGKKIAKSNRQNTSFIGNIIDVSLQNMHHGQTNGIPQGSVLMDFIAEIVLGYADKKLGEKLGSLGCCLGDYYIVRYRDDYRIFVNNPIDGDLIVKCLCEVSALLGLKLNPEKTSSGSDIISSSIKPDKLFWIKECHYNKNVQKHLLIIHGLASKYPNSGSLIIALKEFYLRLTKEGCKIKDNYPLISIIVDIAYNNPKVYPDCAAILSYFISQIHVQNEKEDIIKKIYKRFNNTPNTGHLQIWLQRISLKFYSNQIYDELLCKALETRVDIWISDWLNNEMKEVISACEIIDQKIVDSLPDVIKSEEFALFHTKQDY